MKHAAVTEKIIGAFYEVYNELGSGFLESVYERALCMVLSGFGMAYEVQKQLQVSFRGAVVGEFRADLIVDGVVLVELKAARAIDDSHIAQTLNYLRATGLEVGLVLNFGPKPGI